MNTQLENSMNTGIPTLGEIDYALRGLRDTLRNIETQQRINYAHGIALEIAQANYVDAAKVQGVGTGLMMAENLVLRGIEILERRRLAVEQFDREPREPERVL